MNATKPRDKNKTNQDYKTDLKFWNVLDNLHDFQWDLACTKDNCLVRRGGNNDPLGYHYPAFNALDQDWHELNGWLYLNPPFKDIKPWAKKCWKESEKGATIAMLVPASVGSVWFHDYVFNKAHVLFLKGRLTFQGETAPYPKDLILCIYGDIYKGCNIWDWRVENK